MKRQTSRLGWASLATALFFLLAPVLTAQSPFVGPPGGAAAPFTWLPTPHDLGRVQPPPASSAALSGWIQGPPGTLVRLVPGLAANPVLEVMLLPPLSGHATSPERFLVQFPIGLAPAQLAERALLVAFHSYGVSEKSVFLWTPLPALCAERGWILLVPYGLVDTSFANPASQQALAAVLALVERFFAFDRERVYGVGFSMGGLCALSYAMRHQSPERLRFAGLVVHTPTIDVAREYERGTPFLRALLADPAHFGGSPAQAPFAFERTSPLVLKPSGGPDAERAPVTNLAHVPLFLHLNLDDPNRDLLVQAYALYAHLVQQGASVRTHVVAAGPQHSWSTLPMAEALCFLERLALPQDPRDARVFADRAERWSAAEVRALEPERHARFHVAAEPSTNALAVDETRALDELALDLAALGLDAARALELATESADGTADALVLGGYPAPPAAVTLEGLPYAGWSHDAARAELRVTTPAGGGAARLRIEP